MLPFYAARIEDLGLGDFVKVDCAACHHVALLTPEGVLRLGRRSELDRPRFGPIWRRAIRLPRPSQVGGRAQCDFTEGGHDKHARTSVFGVCDLER